MKDQTVNIEELVQDQHNFNKGTEEGARLMEKSFTELGAGRSILIDKDGNIIAGNKSQKAAMAAGIKKVRVIESDGTELIAVKRTDISIDSKEGRELALADNLTTQVNLAWDNVELASVAAEQGIDLPDWGLDPAELELTDEAEIERKRKEFEERMAAGEISEEDEEYQAFLQKFELKKTTDDCYTPELIYEAVANWVANEYGLNRKNFVRPFYPGGDYQNETYPADCIVVDNPPFSILSEIQRFYVSKGIKFFIFAPSLTLFGSQQQGTTVLPIDVTCTYANGANVNASFITNLEDPSIRFRSVPELYAAVKVPLWAVYRNMAYLSPFASMRASESANSIAKKRQAKRYSVAVTSFRTLRQRRKQQRRKQQRRKQQRRKQQRRKQQRQGGNYQTANLQSWLNSTRKHSND